ncbi:MAG: bifunctional diguanylate cyclase/phosphodiesterase [Desulfobacterales bacterium]
MGISTTPRQSISLRLNVAALKSASGSSLRKADNEYEALCNIISEDRIQTVFQPIFDLKTGEVYAYESLARFDASIGFANTAAVFQAARKHQLTACLESLCRQNTYSSMARLAIDRPVAINISPHLLQRPPSAVLNELYTVQDRIILELTERYRIRDQQKFAESIEFYRQAGFVVAIDDLGAGFAGLSMLARIQPSIVKIDRFIIDGIQHSTKKQMLLEAMVSFCRKINALVVAEGIENAEELKTILPMQVDLAQGFFLGRPEKSPGKCNPEAKKCIDQYRCQTAMSCPSASVANTIGTLMSPTLAVDDSASVKCALDMFNADKTVLTLPVVHQKKPAGILSRTDLYTKIGQQYGFSLFSQKPVASIMKPATVFEAETSLEEVTRKVLDRKSNAIYDAVIVVKNGAYVGTVQIYELLQRITEQKILLARQANPLTGLPGNNLIKAEILHRLEKKELFAVLYIDLDNFKPFNDNFGFEKGDQVLRYLGHMLQEELLRWDVNAFVGHVGGDDFVIVCRSGQIDALCRCLITRFQYEVKQFHDEQSIVRQCYWSYDRLGRKRQYRLLTISIAVVTTEHRAFESYGHLVSVASEIKKKVKNNGGNSYQIDRRSR